MKTYIALLRGINVGGHRKILMADLKEMMHSIGYENCITYIQSGNLIFKSTENNTSVIAENIKTTIHTEFGFEVPTLVLPLEELQKAINETPYSNEDINQLYYTFLSSKPSKENIDTLSLYDFGEDNFTLKNNGIYIFYATKASNSKLSNNIIEKKLAISATSRNWKTMLKLESIAQELN